MSYPISDMLVSINNAQAVGKEQISVPFSKMKFKIAQILNEGGFIGEIERRKKKSKKSEFEYLAINLKYGDDGRPGVSGFKLISRPSRHMYTGTKDIKSIKSGYGFSVISTSKGIMNSKDARKAGLGGEILFEVW
jgi:small subunit ribosomal protein S8